MFDGVGLCRVRIMIRSRQDRSRIVFEVRVGITIGSGAVPARVWGRGVGKCKGRSYGAGEVRMSV